MKKLKCAASSKVALAWLLAVLGIPTAHADVSRGHVMSSGSLAVEYVYESSSNSFAIDVGPLFSPGLASLEFTTVEKTECDALEQLATSSAGGVGSGSVRAFDTPSPLSLRVRVAKPYLAPEYAMLVQADLQARGISVTTPRNVTQLDRTSLQLGFIWDARAISVLGKRDLVSKAQGALLSSWTVTDDASGIYATATDREALMSAVCDLQSRRLVLSVAYDYRDRFFYFERVNAQASTLLDLWQHLSAKSAWLGQVSGNDDFLSARDARLVAGGSLLTLELLRANPRSPLLEPGAFVKLYTAVFNPVSAELNRIFDPASASDLTDRLGKPNQIDFPVIQGAVNL